MRRLGGRVGVPMTRSFDSIIREMLNRSAAENPSSDRPAEDKVLTEVMRQVGIEAVFVPATYETPDDMTLTIRKAVHMLNVSVAEPAPPTDAVWRQGYDAALTGLLDQLGVAYKYRKAHYKFNRGKE